MTSAIRWAAPAIVVATNVYLGFHWVSDMVAGILLGLLIEQLLQTARHAAGPRTPEPSGELTPAAPPPRSR